MTWDSWITRWLPHLAERGLKADTVRKAELALRRWQAYCRKLGLGPGQVSCDHLESFVAELGRLPGKSGTGVRQVSSLNGDVSALRDFFQGMVKRGLLFQDPTLTLFTPRPPEPTPRSLTVEQVELLLVQPDPCTPLGVRDRAILETFYSSGLRLAEVRLLDLHDVDLSERCLSVRRGKAGSCRVLPIGRRLAEALEAYLRRSRPGLFPGPGEKAFFVSRYGGRLDKNCFNKLLRLATKKSGLKLHVTTHMLRHSCATHMLEGGASLEDVGRFLGHQCLRSTMIYTRLSSEAVAREHRRTHPRSQTKEDQP
ncbi:hypothetical protein DYH09_33540 [bacterium CPR1]|nr:hypothetical protein [bacterium CPR1]